MVSVQSWSHHQTVNRLQYARQLPRLSFCHDGSVHHCTCAPLLHWGHDRKAGACRFDSYEVGVLLHHYFPNGLTFLRSFCDSNRRKILDVQLRTAYACFTEFRDAVGFLVTYPAGSFVGTCITKEEESQRRYSLVGFWGICYGGLKH